MSKVLYRLGWFCARHPYITLGVWVLVLGAIGAGVFFYGRETTNVMRVPGTEYQVAADLLEREFPEQEYGRAPIVFHVAEGKLTDPAVKKAVQDSIEALREKPGIGTIIDPYSRAGESGMSKDEQTAVADVQLDISNGVIDRAMSEDIMAAADPARAAGVQVEVGGIIGYRLSEVSSERSEIIGIAAGLVILAFTFGTLVAAGLPIITALIGLVTGLGIIGLLGHVFDIPVYAPTVATMLALGVGIDYALFIIFRYRDEIHSGVEVKEAVARSMATSGSAVVFAGMTVIIALLALLISQVPILGTMGWASSLAVFVAVITAITLVPAILGILGHRIDSLRLPGWKRLFSSGDKENIWSRWAGLVTRHPWIALGAALLVLLPLAIPTLSLRFGQEDPGVGSPDTTTRRSFDLISEGLYPGTNGPLVVITEFNPALKANAAYEKKRAEAEALADEIKKDKKALEKKAEALKKQAAALEKEQGGVESQASGLRAKQGSLQEQAAAVESQAAQLRSEQASLQGQQASLNSRAAALQSRANSLRAQIASVQQQLASSEDPDEIASLQNKLENLNGQASQVQSQSAALQNEGAALRQRAASLSSRASALQARAAALQAQGANISASAAGLSSQGSALSRKAAKLKAEAKAIKAERAALEKKGKRAKALKKEIEDMLVDAAGEALGTDARLISIKDTLAKTAGIGAVTGPMVNEKGNVAVLLADATTRPADPVTADLVAKLRTEVLPAATADADGVTARIGGETAAYSDLANLISDRLPLVIATVLALSFIILLIAFRSLLVPVKAILCNLLAVGAAFGVLTAVFQWGWGLSLIGIDSPYGTVTIASYVPLLMFCVLFGMSTDYEVFLISQIFGFHEAGEDSHQSVRDGVGASARVITSAALIMVVVFASFILHPDPLIKQFGVGLSVAILLDATIVRLVIVPSTMVLMGDWNWYLPKWLHWLHRLELPQHHTPQHAAGHAAPQPAAAPKPAYAGFPSDPFAGEDVGTTWRAAPTGGDGAEFVWEELGTGDNGRGAGLRPAGGNGRGDSRAAEAEGAAQHLSWSGSLPSDDPDEDQRA